MRKAQFRIEAIHPSLNAWSRQNPFRVAKLKKELATFADVGILQAQRQGTWDGQPFGYARMTVILHPDNLRRMDLDNRSPKFFGDQLVNRGVLIDDCDSVVPELILKRGTKAKPAWTEILIEELTEGESR